jgi:flagellar biosynthetic protein FliR
MFPEITAGTGIPGIELAALSGLLLQFIFATLRMGAFVVSAPLFSARFIPLQVRIIFSVFLGIAVMGIVPMPAPERLSQLDAITIAITELVIGLCAGLVLQILFAAATMAGDWISNTAGLGFAAQVDPATGSQSPVISQMFGLFLLMIFVTEDGHLLALEMLLKSYSVAPVGGAIDPQSLLTAGINAVGTMFVFAAQLMLPIVSVLLVVNVVIGVITRSAPQMNLFSFGFPLTVSATLLLLFATAPSLGGALYEKIDASLDLLGVMVGGLGGG